MAPTNSKSAPKPRQQRIDIYNSTSTGHQVGSGVSKPSTWHKSRSAKLQQQFKSNPTPLASCFVPKLVTSPSPTNLAATAPAEEDSDPKPASDAPSATSIASLPSQQARLIFEKCNIYINGSTAPTISDVELKRLLSLNGARISITLARKTTTHVIVSKPSNSGGSLGAGGALAAGKLQKEIARKGNNIKYVSVDWVLESMKAGRRLPESKYSILNLYGERQESVASIFAKKGVADKENATPPYDM